mgnify:CR=1 FL=1
MNDYKYYIDNGIYDIQRGEFESAIDNINKSIELKDDWEISYFYRGVAHQAMQKFDDAILDYTKALQINPKMADAYNNRAEIMLSRKDIENPDINKIIADFEKALELDDKFINALFGMAAAYKKLGDYHKSLEYLERLLEIEPDAIQAKALKKLILKKYII